MHPREAEGFEWDDENRRKLARRQIWEWEVEEVFWNRPVWAQNKKGRSGDYIMVGRTDGGRRLTIPIQVKPATRQLRAITGWLSSQAELSKYGRGRR